MGELLTVENAVLAVLAFTAFVVVIVAPIFGVFVVWVDRSRGNRRLEGLRAACRELRLEDADDGWWAQVDGQRVVTRLFQSRWGGSRGRTSILTRVRVEPSSGERVVLFHGCIHDPGRLLPFVGDWLSRPLPTGGTFGGAVGGEGGHIVPVKLGYPLFDDWFHLFGASPDRTTALFAGDVSTALLASKRDNGFSWFDGETLDLLYDLDGRPDPDWVAVIREERAVAGRIAATIAARVRG